MKHVLLFSVIAVTISIQLLVAQATFSVPVDFSAGGSVQDVSVGDLNADGKPDLVAVRVNYLVVFLNTTTSGASTPSFSAGTLFVTNGTAMRADIGDINGDGKPDLVVPLFSNNTVAVFLNTTTAGAATPSMSAQTVFATASFPMAVDLGDINGDSKLDLAVTSTNGNNVVSILLNTTISGAATPSFSSKVDFTVATNPIAVFFGDVNGDGKPDMVSANSVSASVSVLLNTTTTGASTPSFSTSTDFTTGIQPNSVSMGDLNGDGKLDMAVANPGSGTVSVFMNTTTTGGATPSFTAKADFTTGNAPQNAFIGDIDGDGKPDMAVSRNTNPGNVTIFLNTTTTGASTPTFAAKSDHTVGTGALFVFISDCNADSKLDLAVASAANASVLLSTTVQLPVELTSFTGSVEAKTIELLWKTATEVNNFGFEIERYLDASTLSPKNGSIAQHDWTRVGFVEGSGTTNAPKEYSFTDKNLSVGKYSYRLKQIDRDGKFAYSQTVEVEIGSLPKEFVLMQNYPNPFNPSTVISYQLPATNHISLKVYDAIGREVATLVNETKEAGTYSAKFDGANLSSGIYFARLSSNGKSQMKKLLLMK